MKPIAIIAIIAAVVVVGGACAGVAFSGVLNGGTTGPGGDNPVVPTEPVEPTPTETPTETPTPTETQMSTFSPMTSSSSSSSSSSGSGSGGSDTPVECEHAETEFKSNNDGTHSEVCKACGETITRDDCTYSYQSNGDTAPFTHTKTCGVCNYVATEECTEIELKSNNDGTHSNVCKKCGVKVTKDNCAYAHYQYIGSGDTHTHSKLCDVCGHFVEAESCTTPAISHDEGENTHSEKCTLCKTTIGATTPCFADETAGWTTDSGDGVGTHSRTCQTPGCGQKYTEACDITGEGSVEQVDEIHKHKLVRGSCTCGRTGEGQIVDCFITYASVSGETPQHTPKCEVCGKTYTGETTNCDLTPSYTSKKDEMHTKTVKCAVCDYSSSSDEECKFEKIVYNLAGDNPTKSAVCKDCDYVKTAPVVAAIGGVGYVTFADAIAEVKEGETLVILRAGDYSISDAPAGITIDGNDKATITDIYTLNAGITIENCAIVAPVSSSAAGSQVKGDVTFRDCSFTGQSTGASVWFDSVADDATVTFENCEFTDYLKLGSAEAYIFNSCTFGGKGKANYDSHIRSYAPITLNDCTFTADDGQTSNVCLADGMDPSTSIEVKGNDKSALVSFGSSDESRTIAKVDANGIHVADLGIKGYASVEKAVEAAVTTGSTEEVKLIVDMIAPSTIAEGYKVTINPNTKKTLLIYKNITDIKIKDALGTDSKVNVTGSGEGAAELVVFFNATADENDMLVIDYALSDTEMYIGTVAGLSEFAEMVNGGDNFAGKTVKLMNNIDLNNEAWTSISEVKTIGEVPFAGTFDGQGHTISNLKDAPLFGKIGETGVVKNVILKDVSITNKNDIAFLATHLLGTADNCIVKNAVYTSNGHGGAGLIHDIWTGAKVKNCHVYGFTLTVTSNDAYDKTGGFAGTLYGTVTDCSVSDVTLNAARKPKQWGGFAGIVSYGTIENCSAENVTITVGEYYQLVGGFAGHVKDSTIKNCKANDVTIDVTATGVYTTDSNVGGFAGSAGGNVEHTTSFDNCKLTGLNIKVTGDVADDSVVCGFLGEVHTGTGDTGISIKNCSVEGEISATAAVGTRVGKLGIVAAFTSDDSALLANEGNTANVTIK